MTHDTLPFGNLTGLLENDNLQVISPIALVIVNSFICIAMLNYQRVTVFLNFHFNIVILKVLVLGNTE